MKMRKRYARLRASLLILGAMLCASAVGCGSPPQIGDDKDTFRAVDALYTAVSLREQALVARCESQLAQLRDAGKLPVAASDALTSIINEARNGQWEPAQARLARFMEGQRP